MFPRQLIASWNSDKGANASKVSHPVRTTKDSEGLEFKQHFVYKFSCDSINFKSIAIHNFLQSWNRHKIRVDKEC